MNKLSKDEKQKLIEAVKINNQQYDIKNSNQVIYTKYEDKQRKRNKLIDEINKDSLSFTRKAMTKITKLSNFIKRLNDGKQVQNERVLAILEYYKDDYEVDIRSSKKSTSKQIKLDYCKRELDKQLELIRLYNKKIEKY